MKEKTNENNEEKSVESNKYVFHDTVISWAIIIWAVVSFALMVYFTDLNQVTFSIMTFGQLFLISGLICLSRNRKIGCVHTATGLGCIIIPAINEWGYLFNENLQVNILLPILLTTALTIIGLAMMIIPGVLENISEKRCKKEVKAECVDFKSTTSKTGNKLYAPVYRYSVDDKEYERCTNQYAIEKKVRKGSKISLMVNEKNPEQVHIPASKPSKMLIYIFGICFFIAGLGMMITVLAEI